MAIRGRSYPAYPTIRRAPYYRYISPGNYSTSGYQAATNNPAWNHTVVGNFLPVWIGLIATATVNSVTFNSVNLVSKPVQNQGTDAGQWWVWDVNQGAIPTGTHQISASLSGVVACVGMAQDYFNVDLTTPVEVTGGSTATAHSISDVVTTLSPNAWVIDGSVSAVSTTDTPGGSQTERGTVTGAGGEVSISDRGPFGTVGTNVTMSWSDTDVVAPARAHSVLVLREQGQVAVSSFIWQQLSDVSYPYRERLEIISY